VQSWGKGSELSATQLQHYIINHVMAKGLQRLYLKKGSVRWHENELLRCACIFFAGHLTAINKQEGRAADNNGISGSVMMVGGYDTYSALSLNGR